MNKPEHIDAFAQALGGWDHQLTGSCTVRQLVVAIDGELIPSNAQTAWDRITQAVRGMK